MTMKITTKLTFAAAALLAAAATLSAETLKAEIPFRFDAMKAPMQPGAYSLSVSYGSSGHATIRFLSLDDRRSVMTIPMTVSQSHTGKSEGNPVLTFQCTDGRCQLAKIWDGNTNLYTFATSRPDANTRLASVPVKPDGGN